MSGEVEGVRRGEVEGTEELNKLLKNNQFRASIRCESAEG